MSRSIDDWYADHGRASLGDDVDDDVAELQSPWDVQSSGTATTRASRRAIGLGPAPISRGGTSRGGGTPKRRAGGSGRGATAGESLAGVDAAASIRRVARDNPNIGYKKIAAILRAEGLTITKAQVADTLARAVASRRATGSRAQRPPKPAMVVKIAASAQVSRPVHTTPLCPSCGVRLTVIGLCRCS